MTSALPEEKRQPLDDYPTPAWAVDAILPHLHVHGAILEPACGAGTVLARLATVRLVPKSRMTGIEIHEPRAQQARDAGYTVLTADALDAATVWPRADLIISNPPFRQAEIFCRKSFASVARHATVAMLLRLAFFESAERYAFHAQHPVTAVHVFSSRPSFSDNGKTDSAAYAWFLWGGVEPGIFVLPPNVTTRRPRRARQPLSPITESISHV